MPRHSPSARNGSSDPAARPVLIEALEERRLLSVTLTAGALIGVEGKSVKGVVATFVSSDASPRRTSYAATINWDDGQTTIGKVVVDKAQAGLFDVIGKHRYVESEHFHPSVSIHDAVDGTDAQIDSSARISDAALKGSRKTIGAKAGVSFTRMLANFHDANRFSTAGDFTATIDWGDGSLATDGTIIANGRGSFRVLGTHGYAAAGKFNITVSIDDQENSSVTVVSTAKVKA